MDELTSPELMDSPELHISIHALYSCCSDALKSISAVELHNKRFKAYYARLKIWGAGLFTEGPSLDEILKEEPERYRPLLVGLQKTLFSIAVEEGRSGLSETPHISINLALVVFLKSRRALNSNYDTDLRLEPQTEVLLDLVSQSDTAVLACERRLPHLVNTPEIDTTEPLTLQSSSSQGIRPCSSNRRVARDDQSLKSHSSRRGLVDRISEKFAAGNEVISLFTKKQDAVGRVRATSPFLGEHGLKDDENASLSQPSEACHEDYKTYFEDFVESLFDLLPSIRGIRRTRLLENEFHQSNKSSSPLGLVRQATPQAAQTLPESKIQSDRDNTESRTTKEQLRRPRYYNPLSSSSSTNVFGFLVSDIVASRSRAAQIYSRCVVEGNRAGAVVHQQLGEEIRTFIDSLKQLESIIENAEEQSLTESWHFNAVDTWATILRDTLWEVTGDFIRTLDNCEQNLEAKRNVPTNGLSQRVKFHMIKILLICKPFELHLLRGIHGELQQVTKDVAPLKGIFIKDTAQSIHLKRPIYRNRRVAVPPDLAKRFEKALAASKPDSVQARDFLPLREGFDALVLHVANSMVEFKPISDRGKNTPKDTRFVNLLKSAWILDKLKDGDELQSAGPESLWADCIRELEDKITAQMSRFDTGELEPPTPDVISGLPDHCYPIRFTKDPWRTLQCFPSEDTWSRGNSLTGPSPWATGVRTYIGKSSHNSSVSQEPINMELPLERPGILVTKNISMKESDHSAESRAKDPGTMFSSHAT